MYLFSSISEFNVFDMIVQLFFFIMIIAFIIGVISLIIKFIKRNRRFGGLEEKADKVLSDKDNL